jgi:hypothetical protein
VLVLKGRVGDAVTPAAVAVRVAACVVVARTVAVSNAKVASGIPPSPLLATALTAAGCTANGALTICKKRAPPDAATLQLPGVMLDGRVAARRKCPCASVLVSPKATGRPITELAGRNATLTVILGCQPAPSTVNACPPAPLAGSSVSVVVTCAGRARFDVATGAATPQAHSNNARKADAKINPHNLLINASPHNPG